jgi:hypothetical protein
MMTDEQSVSRFSLIRLQLAHCANRSLSFVRLAFVDEETKGSYVYCLLTVQRKFVICPFVDEETKGSYSFANSD